MQTSTSSKITLADGAGHTFFKHDGTTGPPVFDLAEFGDDQDASAIAWAHEEIGGGSRIAPGGVDGRPVRAGGSRRSAPARAPCGLTLNGTPTYFLATGPVPFGTAGRAPRVGSFGLAKAAAVQAGS
jgi:hypothetical protein